MAEFGTFHSAGSRLITLLATIGLIAVMSGGALVATSLTDVSAAATTTTLSLTTSAPGTTCNNSNPAAPVCSGLAGGDVVNVSGTGFAPGAEASVVQCNSAPTQPQVFFLGNDIPVSCSPLFIVSIGSKKSDKGDLTATHTLTEGIVGPPEPDIPDTCTETEPSTTTITGCTATTAAADAALYPCPPTSAQEAAGITCVLAIGDIDGDRAVGTVLFGAEKIPTSTTTTTGGGSSTTSGATSTTGATTTTGVTTTTAAPPTTTTTSPTSTSTNTQVSASSVTLASGTVTDTVTVRGTPTNGSPSGNVNFYVCQTGTTQTKTPGPCAATAGAHLDTAHLVAGSGNGSTATTAPFTPTAAGTWCFSAVYGGDSVYTGSADNTSVANLDANECVLVRSASSTTSTFISSVSLILGPSGAATDAVTVAGNVVGGSPTGGVTFYACHTSITLTLAGGPCPASGIPEDAAVALLPGAGDTSSATSNTFVPTSVGTWCFSVVYGGSLTYSESADNTSASNVDSNECLLVSPPSGDSITSDPNAAATAGVSFSFSVTTSGLPTPHLKKKGRLPKGVHFVNNQNGTATLYGTPNLNKGIGVYHVTIVARFGQGKSKVVVMQAFTLTVA